PAFAQSGHQDGLHSAQGHRGPAPCRRDKAVGAVEIAPLVNLNECFAVRLLYGGPEVAGCRLFASADRFGVHRSSLTSAASVLHGLLSIHADSRMAAMQSVGVGAEPSAIAHPDELSRLHVIPLRLS